MLPMLEMNLRFSFLSYVNGFALDDCMPMVRKGACSGIPHWNEARYVFHWEYMRSSWPVVNSSYKLC